MEVRYKTCKGCQQSKPVYEFASNKQTVDGLMYKCRTCFKRQKKPTMLETILKNSPFVPCSFNRSTKKKRR